MGCNNFEQCKLSVRSMRKYGRDSDDAQWWESRTHAATEALGETRIERQKLQLKLKTSTKQVQFGRNMVFDFLREL